MPATATRRPPWQHPRRRQVAAGIGVLLLAYAVLFVIALLGGPRIGASFLPLPGGGPDPASPVAGLQPGQSTQTVTVPHQTPSTPAATPTATPTVVPTQLPTATTPPGATVRTAGSTVTPGSAETPTPEIVESTGPTHPPVTERPPTDPTTTAPTEPTVPPVPPTTATPTASPTSPTTPPTTPNDPNPPGKIGGFLGRLLHKLGL
ncbi:hypothetical protein ACXJJ3_25525 [Kribbella sp. WER1]